MIYVADVMSKRVRTIDSKGSLREAAKLMTRWKIGCLIIVRSAKPVGIITEGDVSKAVGRGLDPSKTPVNFLHKKLVTIGPMERIEDASRLMASAGVKKLPVMEGGRLVGILTQTDIVETSFGLVTSLKEMVSARFRPPDFDSQM